MSTDRDRLARLAHVEPPPELDAWVRMRWRAALAEHARDAASAAAAPTPMRADAPSSLSRDPSRAMRAAVRVPLVERLALTVGAVACGAQASAFLLRMVWSALSLGR